MFKLSANLLAHESDVKDLAFDPNDDTLLSVSRDGKCLRWSPGPNQAWFPKEEFTGSNYLNSVAADDISFYIGCLDGTIMSRGMGGFNQLKGHEKNVCALTAKHGLVASGSWDCTARVWQKGECVDIFKGHKASVWGVVIIDPNTIVTCSADATIKIWKDGSLFKTITGHSDVVRDLCDMGNGMFASCSNDGSIKVWTVNGDLVSEMHGHTSFVYKVEMLASGELVSCGEDRSCRVWKDNECVQVITLPCISVWSVAINSKGDIACGGSDYAVRIFSRDESRWASEEEIKELSDTVAGSGIGKDQVGEVNKEQLSGPEILEKDGEKEGQVVMVKTESGQVEAHQWSSGMWIKIGEVVGSNSSSSSGQKQEFEGKKYDYVFYVDVEDGRPQLPLPYNLSDNPYTAAKKFLERNELPESYLNETAQFIISNTEGVNLSQQAPAANSDPYGSRYVPSDTPATTPAAAATAKPNTKIIPYTSYLKLTSYQAAPIIKAIKTNNVKQPGDTQLGQLELEMLEQNLQNITGDNAPSLFKTAVTIVQSWPAEDMLPGLDVLRLAVAAHPAPPTAAVIQMIFSTLDPDAPKHALLATRALVNLFSTEEGRKLAKNPQVCEQAVAAIRQLMEKEAPQNARSIAAASLIVNYAVLTGQNSDLALGMLDNVNFLTSKCQDPESTYRLLVAFGTILANHFGLEEVKQAASGFGLVEWADKVDKSEQRVADLVAEIKQLL